MGYRKNNYRRDIMNRFGPETGLPLFEPALKPAPEHIKARLNGMPKSILTATETRKLAEMTAKADAMRLAEKQSKIYDVMYLRDDWSNTEIAEYMELPINQIVGRVFELRQMGLVIPSRKRQCSVTHMIITAWRVK
jgi:hypothetical protein